MNTHALDGLIARTVEDNRGATVEEVVNLALDSDIFDDVWRESAIRDRAAYEVRKRFKAAHVANGLPKYYRVGVEAGESGEDDEESVEPAKYKTVDMFTAEEFEQAAEPYRRMVDRGVKVLTHLRDVAALAGVQLRLPLWMPELVPA